MRVVAGSGAATAAVLMLSAGPVLAGWSATLNQGDAPPYHYAVAERGTSNANIGALALECHVEGGRPVWQLQLYPASEGPIGPAEVPAEEIDARGAYLAIEGKRYEVDPLGAGDFLALSDSSADGFAGISDKVVDAIATAAGAVEIFLDMVPDGAGPQHAGFESTAVFALQGAGAAIAEVRGACR